MPREHLEQLCYSRYVLRRRVRSAKPWAYCLGARATATAADPVGCHSGSLGLGKVLPGNDRAPSRATAFPYGALSRLTDKLQRRPLPGAPLARLPYRGLAHDP